MGNSTPQVANPPAKKPENSDVKKETNINVVHVQPKLISSTIATFATTSIVSAHVPEAPVLTKAEADYKERIKLRLLNNLEKAPVKKEKKKRYKHVRQPRESNKNIDFLDALVDTGGLAFNPDINIDEGGKIYFSVNGVIFSANRNVFHHYPQSYLYSFIFSQGKFAESGHGDMEQPIVLHGVDSEVFEVILEFYDIGYKCLWCVDLEQLQRLKIAADYFCLQELSNEIQNCDFCDSPFTKYNPSGYVGCQVSGIITYEPLLSTMNSCNRDLLMSGATPIHMNLTYGQNICLPYLNEIKLLEPDFLRIVDFIEEVCQKKPRQMVLKYKGTYHGMSTMQFHKNCDYVERLLVLIYLKDQIWGGYSNMPFVKSLKIQCTPDNKSFIFNHQYLEQLNEIDIMFSRCDSARGGPCSSIELGPVYGTPTTSSVVHALAVRANLDNGRLIILPTNANEHKNFGSGYGQEPIIGVNGYIEEILAFQM